MNSGCKNLFKMNSKFIVVVLIVSLCSMTYFSAVIGKPNGLAASNFQQIDGAVVGGNRTKRELIAIVAVAAIYGVGLASMSIANSNKCSVEAGCHKGKCWAWCGVSLSDGEWCYTTKTYSQSYNYVACTTDYDCEKCWRCGGPCSIFWSENVKTEIE